MKLLLSLLSASMILSSTASAVDISNLSNCVADIKKYTARPNDLQPLFTSNYQALMAQLKNPSLLQQFPPVYQQQVVTPFIGYLDSLGASNFAQIFVPNPTPQNNFLKNVLPDITEAILQNGMVMDHAVTDAFQEMVSDLYDGFLSDENRVSRETGQPIKPPDLGVLPPLVKWGNADAGPYTWTEDATRFLKVGAPIVSLPPNNRKGGLLAWSALPHETAGHDVLHADNGLLTELGTLVYNALMTALPNNPFLAYYWQQCIDETSSDVLGLLNGGPMIGIGLVGYFRGLRNGTLSSYGAMPPADTHPIDILRGCLAAQVVSQMPFSTAKQWSDTILQETMKDLQNLILVDPSTKQQIQLNQQAALQSAKIVADTIVNSKLSSLEGHSLKEIQNWSEQDQAISEALGMMMASGAPFPMDYKNSGYYAAHVVAGAVLEAMKANANIEMLFARMVTFLSTMHQYNQTWAGTTMPPLPPAPPPGPVPTPDDQCACICQCVRACQQKSNVVVKAPRLGTQHSVETAIAE